MQSAVPLKVESKKNTSSIEPIGQVWTLFGRLPPTSDLETISLRTIARKDLLDACLKRG